MTPEVQSPRYLRSGLSGRSGVDVTLYARPEDDGPESLRPVKLLNWDTWGSPGVDKGVEPDT